MNCCNTMYLVEIYLDKVWQPQKYFFAYAQARQFIRESKRYLAINKMKPNEFRIGKFIRVIT